MPTASVFCPGIDLQAGPQPGPPRAEPRHPIVQQTPCHHRPGSELDLSNCLGPRAGPLQLEGLHIGDDAYPPRKPAIAATSSSVREIDPWLADSRPADNVSAFIAVMSGANPLAPSAPWQAEQLLA